MHVLQMAISYAGLIEVHPHSHEHWEIILNLKGSGHEVVNGLSVEFCPGTVSICPPGDTHYKKSNQEGFQDMYAVLTDTPVLQRLTRPFFEDDAAQSIGRLMDTAHRWFHSGSPNAAGIADGLLETICLILTGWDESAPIPQDVERMQEVIIRSYTDPEFHAAEVLRLSPYAPDHARRRFIRAIGQPPVAYMNGLRIALAERLIRTSGSTAPIAEIALRSGFYDVGYFIRMFRRMTGQTPGMVRSRFTNESSGGNP